MSLLHDFSDPPTITDDNAYWFKLYQIDPVQADQERVKLLRLKITERSQTRIDAAPLDQRAKVVAEQRLHDEDLYLKIFRRMQEMYTAKTPEERLTIAAKHLIEDAIVLFDALKPLQEVIS